MGFWETLTGWIDRDRRAQIYVQFDSAKVEPRPDDEVLVAGGSYVRVKLATMFLRKEVAFAKRVYPAVHSLVRFSFGDRIIELPGLADSTRLGNQQNARGDLVAHNFALTPIMPFNGGDLAISASLIALEGENYLASALGVLGNFADQLMVTQLSAALNIAQPLARGIQDLFGAGNGRVHLGFHNSYKAGQLRNGYVAAVAASREEIDPDRLRVKDDLLWLEGGGRRLDPLEGYDYLLLRTEVSKTRDDWNGLTSIQEPFQEALKALRHRATESLADEFFRAALLKVWQAPELTEAHRRIVKEKLKTSFETAKKDFQESGIIPPRVPTLRQVMKGREDVRAALAAGPLTLEDIDAAAPASPAVKEAAPGRDVTASPSAPEPPSFCFSLLGGAVEGNSVRCGSEVSLVFNFDVPSPDALTTIAGEGINRLPQQGGELGVSVIPAGLTVVDGRWYQVAKFDGGRLEAPLNFRLKADDEPNERAVLHVILDRRGRVIYEFDLSVRVVESVAAPSLFGERRPLHLDLDRLAAERARQERTATLVLQADGDRLNAFYKEASSFTPLMFPLPTTTRTTLAARLDRATKTLTPASQHYIWTEQVNPLTAEPTPERVASYEECMKYVAAAGSALYADLCEDERLKGILERVSALPSGSRLQIITDSAFIPWEILYPPFYYLDENPTKIQPTEFWGARFTIESLLLGGSAEYEAPLALHEGSAASVSFNLNPAIDDDFKTYKPVAEQAAAAARGLGPARTKAELNVGRDAIREMLGRKENAATLIYFYCHGANDVAFSARSEVLEIDKRVYLEPAGLDRSVKFACGPIIFLNSCSSGAFSPLSFSSFLTRFKDKRALGLIATSFPVPATFAAGFGQALVEEYLAGRAPVGDVLRGLRLRVLQEGNPLGLFYTLQCPLDATAAA